MSEQPGRGSWDYPPDKPGEHAPEPATGPANGRPPGRASGQSASPANGQVPGAANGQTAGQAHGHAPGPANGQGTGPANGQGTGPANGHPTGPDRPGRTSDLGRFDWFAEPDMFGLSGSVPPPPAPPPLPARPQPPAPSAPSRRRRLRPGRRAVAICGLALACTALGGVVGGFVAVHAIDNKPQNSSYSLGAVPSAPSGAGQLCRRHRLTGHA